MAEAGGHVFGRDKRLALRDMMGMPHIFNQVKDEQDLEMEQEQELEQVQQSIRKS